MKYYIEELQEPSDVRPVPCVPTFHDLVHVAEASAEHYFQNGGWECKWPLTFVIIGDEGEETRFEVSLEMTPVFSGKEVKAK